MKYTLIVFWLRPKIYYSNLFLIFIFSMKGVKMYDANARKRDVEELKLEKMKTVDKYFDKWSKITSR